VVVVQDKVCLLRVRGRPHPQFFHIYMARRDAHHKCVGRCEVTRNIGRMAWHGTAGQASVTVHDGKQQVVKFYARAAKLKLEHAFDVVKQLGPFVKGVCVCVCVSVSLALCMRGFIIWSQLAHSNT
jgi:hypothetical protein